MAKHTPGDLIVEASEPGDKERFLVTKRRKEIIAIIQCDDRPRGRGDADAKRLALAWNAHDGLVAACQLAEAYLADTDLDDEPEDGEYGDGKKALLAIRAALAAAQPKPE